jgi:tetratricopeptide (TPR) repeat protein
MNDVADALKRSNFTEFEIEFLLQVMAQNAVIPPERIVASPEKLTEFELAAWDALRVDDPGEVTGAENQKDRALGSARFLNLNLAQAGYELEHGFFTEARTSYSRLLAADPKSIEAVIGLAKLDQLAGHIAEAEQRFRRALQLEDKSAAALDALGQFYVDQNRLDEAIAILKRARLAAPEDKTILFHYAIALAKSEEIRAADPLLIEAVGSAAANYNLGLVLRGRGDLAASEDRFASAVAERPNFKEALYWLNEVRRERAEQLDRGTASVRAGTSAGDKVK